VKTALGMITRNIDSDAEIMVFVENAEKYGHKIDCVITAYTHNLDPRAEQNIQRKTPFFPVDIKDPHYSMEQLRKRGISESTIQTLLKCPVDTTSGLVPYGFNRMSVVIEAILRGVDILFFADTDVIPSVLKEASGGGVLEEVDFFGRHLEILNTGAEVTTSEYSGYNILPPASFDGMEDLLAGLQKAEMLEYWQTSKKHRSLVFQTTDTSPKPCTKILGGNVAIKLSAFKKLPPFFSSYYSLDDELFLNRGEDTVLGLNIAKSGTKCIDIRLNPLHDTYKDYPAEPDLQGDLSAQVRFYYACTGWVGRNPFYNHIIGKDLQSTREFQREHLERGLRALATYTSNRRFLSVLRNFDVSWDSLGRYIDEFEQVSDAWEVFIEKIGV